MIPGRRKIKILLSDDIDKEEDYFLHINQSFKWKQNNINNKGHNLEVGKFFFDKIDY